MIHSAHVLDGLLLRILRLHLLSAHWKSLVVKERGRSIPHPSGPPSVSVAQCLPPEVLLLIFGHLVHLRRDTRVSCSTDPELQFKRQSFALHSAEQTVRRQQYLLRAALTCRSWYTVGVELLYTAPFLSTTRSVDLFRRTLCEESSQLSRFVKDVYLPVTSQGKTSDALCWFWGRRNSKAELDEASVLLNQLKTSLHALTLRHAVKPNLVSMTPLDTLLHNSSIANSLEHLTVFGSTFEARYHPQFSLVPALISPPTESGPTLSNLRTLCLRGLYILPTSTLPYLPHLETLQLVQNYYFSSVGLDADCKLVRSNSLPALRTLELFGEHFAKPDSAGPEQGRSCLESLLDLSIFSILETFTFIQAAEKHTNSPSRCIAVTRVIPSGCSIRHLTLGVISASDHTALACWRLPCAIQTLTILIPGSRLDTTHTASKATSSDGSPLDEEKSMVDGIYRCMEGNPHSDVPCLQELVIVCPDGVSNNGTAAPRNVSRSRRVRTFHDLAELCENRDMTCQAIQAGTHIWRPFIVSPGFHTST